MSRRVNRLSRALTILLLGALVAIGYVGFGTFAPTSRADANIRAFDLAQIPVGGIELVGAGPSRVAVARLGQAKAAVFEVGVLPIDGRNLYRIRGPAAGGPSVEVECASLTTERDSIICLDLDEPVYRWTMDGSPVQDGPSWQPKLPMIPHEVYEGTLRYGRGV